MNEHNRKVKRKSSKRNLSQRTFKIRKEVWSQDWLPRALSPRPNVRCDYPWFSDEERGTKKGSEQSVPQSLASHRYVTKTDRLPAV